jgi:hypothetical protein
MRNFIIYYGDEIKVRGTIYAAYMETLSRDSRRGFGLEIGFIDHFNTRLVATLNYCTIADLHTLQITTAHVNSLHSAVSWLVVAW